MAFSSIPTIGSVTTQITELQINDEFARVEQLLRQKNAREAQRLIEMAIINNSSWFQSEQNKAKLFILATQATTQTHDEELPLLIALQEIDLRFEGDDNKTPLMFAAEAGFRTCVTHFVHNGASISACDSQHQAAWQYIKKLGNNSFLEIIGHLSLDDKRYAPFILSLLAAQEDELAASLIYTLLQLSEQEAPSWWKNNAVKNEIFSRASVACRKSMLLRALHTNALAIAVCIPSNDISLSDVPITHVVEAAQQKNYKLVLAYVRHATLLGKEDENNVTLWEHLKTHLGECVYKLVSEVPRANRLASESLLAILIKKEETHAVSAFFRALLGNPPSWCDSDTASLIFNERTARAIQIQALGLVISQGNLALTKKMCNSIILKPETAQLMEPLLRAADNSFMIYLGIYLTSLPQNQQPSWWNNALKTKAFLAAIRATPSIDVEALCSTLFQEIGSSVVDLFSGTAIPEPFFQWLCENKQWNSVVACITIFNTTAPSWWSKRSKTPGNAFVYAVMDNQKAIAESMLPFVTANCNANTLQITPIIAACKKGWVEAVQALVKKDCYLCNQDAEGVREWQYIATTFGEERLNTILHTLDLGNGTQKLIFDLYLHNKAASAVLLVDKLTRLQFSEQPAWWILRDPRAFAVLGFVNNQTTLDELARSFQYIGEDTSNEWIEAIYLKSPNLYELIMALVSKEQLSRLAQKLIKRLLAASQTEQPEWLRDKRKTTEIFCWAVTFKIAAVYDGLLSLIDVNHAVMDMQGCSWTAVMVAAETVQLDLVLKLISLGAKMAMRSNRGISAFERIITKFNATTVKTIIDNLLYDEADTYHLLLLLMKETSRYSDYIVRILTKMEHLQQPARCWSANRVLATDLFFALAPTKPERAKQVLPYVDVNAVDPRNRNRTPLMVAMEHSLGSNAVLNLLKMGSNLAHIDNENRSVFNALLVYFYGRESPAINEYLRAFLLRIGVFAQQIQCITTYSNLATLLTAYEETITTTYLLGLIPNTETIPLFRKETTLILKMLCCKIEAVRTTLSALSPLERLLTIERIGWMTDHVLRNTLLDLAFEVNSTHYSFKYGSIRVEAKPSSMNVPEAIIALYATYAKVKTESTTNAIQTFANNIKNKTPFYGTPPANTQGLIDFYTQVENAVGNTIRELNLQAIALTTIKGKDIRELVAEQYPDAAELVDAINVVLQDYSATAGYCGGKLLTTVEQQYAYIVKGKARDIQSKIYSVAADAREQIVSSLFPNDEQSTHAYTLFVRQKGERFDLPNAATFKTFSDIFSHPEQIEAAEANFVKAYRPSQIADYMRTYLKENSTERNEVASFLSKLFAKRTPSSTLLEQIEKFHSVNDTNAICALIAKNYGLHPQASDVLSLAKIRDLLSFFEQLFNDMKTYCDRWRKDRISEIMKRIIEICPINSMLTSKRKTEIAAKLAEKPLYMLVDPKDITSLEMVEKMLDANDQLDIALRLDEKLFSPEALVVLLLALRIIK